MFPMNAETRRAVDAVLQGAASQDAGARVDLRPRAVDRTDGLNAQAFSFRHRLLVNIAHAMIMVGVMGLALMMAAQG